MSSTADYTNLAVKGIKKVFDNAIHNNIMQYKNAKVFDIMQTNEYSEIFTSTEGLAGVTQLADAQAPPVLTEGEGDTITVTDDRYGGSIIVNETMRSQSKSSQEKIKTYLERQSRDLLVAASHKFLTSIHELYNNGASTELAPDGQPIFDATHAWNSTTNTFDNTDTQLLDTDAVDTMETYGGAFTDANGIPMPLDFKIIFVKTGSANARMAIKLFAEKISPTAVGDINIYQGTKIIVESPYLTTANPWCALDPRYPNPMYVGINELPNIKNKIVLENEAWRWNVTGFWKKACINMPFNLYYSDGTT